jgi:hypothetical protein
MNILPANMRFGAGQSTKRLEDQRLLTGKGQFIDDKPEDNGVMDALSDLGIKTLNTPLSPLKVWQAIREAKAAGV